MKSKKKLKTAGSKPKSSLATNIKQEPRDPDENKALVEQQNVTIQGTSNENRVVKLENGKPKRKQIRLKHSCPKCSYVGTNLPSHMKTHTDERPFACIICENSFKSKYVLNAHMLIHLGEKRFQCSFCDAKFLRKSDTTIHERHMHTHEKNHQCPHCEYRCIQKSHMTRHIRLHTGEKPYKCTLCPYRSYDNFSLKRHIRVHTGEKPYPCQHCHLRFSQTNERKGHEKRCGIEKPIFECNVESCPRMFSTELARKIHVQKIHSDRAPIKCSRCLIECKDKFTYRIHFATHSMVKLFECDVCGNRFQTLPKIDVHMNIHKKRDKRKRREEFKFECLPCDMKFYTENLLVRHNNIFHVDKEKQPIGEGSHRCSQCEEKFRHKGNLLRHQETHKPGNKKKSKEIEMDGESEDELKDIDEEEHEDEFDDEEDEDSEELDES